MWKVLEIRHKHFLLIYWPFKKLMIKTWTNMVTDQKEEVKWNLSVLFDGYRRHKLLLSEDVFPKRISGRFSLSLRYEKEVEG